MFALDLLNDLPVRKGRELDGYSAEHLPPFLAEAFDFMQEIKDELQSGIVHLAGRAQVPDAAELT